MITDIDSAIITDRVREIFDQDRLMSLLKVRLVAGKPGFVVLEYTVQDNIVQSHGTCHGGVIFSLADAACGIAASAGEHPAVTQICTISYMRPAPQGAVLRATAIERSRASRSVILDVTVTDSSGKTVAELRGTAKLIGQT